MTKPLEPWSAALVLVGAVAVTAASVVGVASPVLAGPVIGSTVAIVVGQALVVALVLGSRRSRPDLGLAATAAVGAVALGLAVTDLQLFARALDADRLDLYRPTAAAAPSPTFGSVALLAGHAAYVVAGVLAAVALARRPSVAVDDAPRRGVLVLLGAAGAAAAVVSPANVSTDSVFLAPSVLGAPLSLALGYVLAALAVLVVVALAATSPRRDVTRGALVGVALSVLLVVVPRVPAAATAGDRIDVGPGTWLGLVGAALLLAAARPDRTAARPNRTDAAGERRRAAERPRRAPNARAWSPAHSSCSRRPRRGPGPCCRSWPRAGRFRASRGWARWPCRASSWPRWGCCCVCRSSPRRSARHRHRSWRHTSLSWRWCCRRWCSASASTGCGPGSVDGSSGSPYSPPSWLRRHSPPRGAPIRSTPMPPSGHCSSARWPGRRPS
ncbi:hypothetical protein [Rhodococcoides kroppenstedtii]|uniref:hypothetical protein n=1 Tax=Rhodococcoides kroppenstedtii TaxID=293050 RepID=UPI000838BC2F|nr:hypothetical protein [Rhodococcus kroppenstedtii]